MKGFLIATQFLTRIPVRVRGHLTERDIGRSAIFFPLVGALQGAPAAAAAFFLTMVFSPDIAAGLVILVLIVTNGGFHIDGLADTADAVSVKSVGDAAEDREKRLAVMKDSAVGAIGVVAIVVAILLKYLLISGILLKGLTWDALCLLFLAPVFSKWIMVPVIFHGAAAKNEGLGAIFIANAGLGVFALSSAMLAAIFFVMWFFLPGSTWLEATKLFLLLTVPLYTFGLTWVVFCRRRFGGMTGDTIGAVSEIAELLFLAVAFLWL